MHSPSHSHRSSLARYSDATPGNTNDLRKPRHGLTRAQWLAQLAEWLPGSYVSENLLRLDLLRWDGLAPGEAAAFCRAYFGAPGTL